MANTTNFGWETPDDTDLVKDGALAMRTLGNAIDTSLVDLKGGTTGQVLSKNTNTDMDFTWVTPNDADAIQNSIVDAKGDLIAASANDTPARLAVGNNGETLVADSSATTGLRYNPPVGSLANPVINGGMDIWQRGISFSFAAGTSAGSSTFNADRWQTATNANQACTVSRQATGDTTNLPNIQYSIRYQRNSGQTGTGTLYNVNNLETTNTIPFAGKTVTLSFYARAGANYSASGSGLGVILQTGTGTDQNAWTGYTGSSNIINSTATLTTTWQRFAFTGTLAGTATEMSVQFAFTPTGTAGANDWYEVTGVQIDVGTWTASTAPTFRRSGGTLAGELNLCKRYYEKSYELATAPASVTALGSILGSCNAAAATTGFVGMGYWFTVEKRGTPTITIYDTAGNASKCSRATLGSNPSTNQTVGIFNLGTTSFGVESSGSASAQGIQFHYVASAEL